MNGLRYTGVLIFAAVALTAAQDVASAIKGTVKKIDSSTKTVVIATEEGAEHTFQLADRTVVHGLREVEKASDETWRGLKEGSTVVVHYTVKGSVDIAEEIDRLGKDGLKAAAGTVRTLDRGGKRLVLVTDEGSEETFHLIDRAAADSGKGIAEGADRSAKITVYYTEEGGRKVAHFFERTF